MEDLLIPFLADCVSIMAHLWEKHVHKLFFTYDATCPDYPHAFFDEHPDIQSLSDVEPKLLKSINKTPQQFYQEITAILICFFLAYRSPIGGQTVLAWDYRTHEGIFLNA
jgi:hypothetical protein